MGPTDFDSNLTQTGLKYITDRNKIKDEFYLRCFIILGPRGASRGEGGDTSPALKKKSVFEKAFCPENV